MAIQLETAQQILLGAVDVCKTEEIDLKDSRQRILAQSVQAPNDFPPFDRSPLDGYALIAGEVEGATGDNPVVLRQIDSVSAGGRARAVVTSGTACRIMTGAELPPGATGVVRLEDVAADGVIVKIFSGKGAAANICRQGEEILTGEEVLMPGAAINMGVIGVLAMLGVHKPLVYKKPRVGILATGNELVEVASSLERGKIRNSNSYMLAAQVRDAGAEPVLLGMAADDVALICDRLAAAECDLVLTTGGASVGDYDLMGAVFARLGITPFFDRVRMKPGMPVIAGKINGIIFVALSGNPAAACISFEQIVRPALLKMAGRKKIWRPVLKAQLTMPLEKGAGPQRFVWARYWQQANDLMVQPLNYLGKGMLKSACEANCLIVVPENSGPLHRGTLVEIVDLSAD